MPSNRSEAVRAPEDGVLRPNAIVFGMAVGVPTADHFRGGMEIVPPAVMIAGTRARLAVSARKG